MLTKGYENMLREHSFFCYLLSYSSLSLSLIGLCDTNQKYKHLSWCNTFCASGGTHTHWPVDRVTYGMCSWSQYHFTNVNISKCQERLCCNCSPSALLSLKHFSGLLSPGPLSSHKPSPYYSPLIQPSCNPQSLITQSSLLLSASPPELRQSLTRPSRPPDSPIFPPHWKSPCSYSPDTIWLIIPLTDPPSLRGWGALTAQPPPSSWETPNLQDIFQGSAANLSSSPKTAVIQRGLDCLSLNLPQDEEPGWRNAAWVEKEKGKKKKNRKAVS